jgi:polyadenylation factor subunit 2
MKKAGVPLPPPGALPPGALPPGLIPPPGSMPPPPGSFAMPVPLPPMPGFDADKADARRRAPLPSQEESLRHEQRQGKYTRAR